MANDNSKQPAQEKKVLHLTLKSQWFDMIESGQKKEEYRELKMYWATRLQNGFPSTFGIDTATNADYKDYNVIRFARGGHFHPSLKQMDVELAGIWIGEGLREWGAEPGKKYFVLRLGKVITSSI
jgi:hypothetical protein